MSKTKKTKIGSFGGISFIVSHHKVLTINGDIKRSETTRWQVHETARGKPFAEFIGPGQESITFKVIFKSNLGVDPFSTIKKLRKFQHEGKVGPFMLGKKTIANKKFYLEDLQETYRHVDNIGRIHTIEADLTLKEYNEEKVKRKKSVKSKSKAKKSKNKKTSNKKQTGTITIAVSHLNIRSGPSLKNGKIKKVAKSGQKFKTYGTKKADGITWYDLGGGLWCSAVGKYTKFTKKK